MSSKYVPSAGFPMRYPVADSERRHAIRVLTKLGHSAADIARRLGICTRTVNRWRARDAAA